MSLVEGPDVMKHGQSGEFAPENLLGCPDFSSGLDYQPLDEEEMIRAAFHVVVEGHKGVPDRDRHAGSERLTVFVEAVDAVFGGAALRSAEGQERSELSVVWRLLLGRCHWLTSGYCQGRALSCAQTRPTAISAGALTPHDSWPH